MSDVDFESLLSVQVESVERPKLFPEGAYSGIVAGHEFGKSTQKGTPYCRFMLKLTAPLEGIDEDAFAEAGGVAGLAERKPLNVELYLTKDAMFRLREFLENTCELSCSGRSFDAVIPETANVPITVHVKHRAGSREGEYYMVVNDTGPAQ